MVYVRYLAAPVRLAALSTWLAHSMSSPNFRPKEMPMHRRRLLFCGFLCFPLARSSLKAAFKYKPHTAACPPDGRQTSCATQALSPRPAQAGGEGHCSLAYTLRLSGFPEACMRRVVNKAQARALIPTQMAASPPPAGGEVDGEKVNPSAIRLFTASGGPLWP